MYTTIKAIYENGQIILQEKPPTTEKTNVIVTFIKEDITVFENGAKLGGLARQGYNIPDDFNAPLADLTEYM